MSVNSELYKIKEDFLNEWPIERLKVMSIEEHTNLEKNSFCYWLEAITSDLGSVWGGSAYKFGIFKRRDLESDNYNEKRKSDGVYAWYGKYGATRNVVFDKVRSIIVSIAENAQEGDLKAIDALDLGDAIKWKIAFLYSDYDIVNIFKKSALLTSAKYLGYDEKDKSFPAMNKYVLSHLGDKDFYDFAKELWSVFDNKKPNRTEFEKWLKKGQKIDSGKISAYLRAIDILENEFMIEVYDEEVLKELEALYEDLKQHQKAPDGKYFFENAKSYGEGGFYSAAVGKFIEFVQREDVGNTEEEEQRLVSILQEVGQNDSTSFYDLMESLLLQVPLKEGDERVCFNLPKSKLFGITIGQKYCVIIERKNRKNTYRYIDTTKNETEWLKETDSINSMSDNIAVIVDSAKKELSKTDKTGYSKHSSSILEKSLFDKDFRNEIFSKAFEGEIVSEKATHDLNKIFFGPPGTGKTYNTINAAISIINPSFNLKQSRVVIKHEFDRLISIGQVMFSTFHQNMSYEDFIEGIKPTMREGSISYEIKDGVFMQICNRAILANYNKKDSGVLVEFSDFDELYELYLENIAERLSDIGEGEKLKLPLKSKGYYTEIKSINEGEEYFLTRGGKANSDAKVHKNRLRLLYNKFKSINDIKDVSNDVRSVGKGLGWSSNYYGVFKDLKGFESKSKNGQSKKDKSINYTENERVRSFVKEVGFPDTYPNNADKFVIIIDEINRGNVSQIFGELITLIEDSKRLGKEEELKAILPYSKREFGVPPNVYLVGTMNTADRSIEALDTALRRRFSFKEMPPKHELIGTTGKLQSSKGKINDLDVVKLLETINDRIEKLIDKDHKIGHSYFLRVSSEDDLRITFNDKVIPLLEEYFYGDYGKISLVLGSSFITKSIKSEVTFAKENEYDPSIASDLLERSVYTVTKMSDWDFKSIYE